MAGPLKSGYYWGYTIKEDGQRLEDKPQIFLYDLPNYTIQLIGCEYEFDAANYELLRPIVFEG